MQLPTIELNGVDYFIDQRLRELRRCDKPHSRIPFEVLKDEGEFYSLKFIRGTDNELAKPGAVYPFGELIECDIPIWAIHDNPETATSNN